MSSNISVLKIISRPYTIIGNINIIKTAQLNMRSKRFKRIMANNFLSKI